MKNTDSLSRNELIHGKIYCIARLLESTLILCAVAVEGCVFTQHNVLILFMVFYNSKYLMLKKKNTRQDTLHHV